MDFYDVLAQVIELLQREGRVSYRALKRQFGLDDDYLEDLKDELLYAKRLAVDEEGKVLVWIGDTPTTPASEAPPTPPTAEAERRQLTVMFCDLVGSTPLSEQLDPEDLREVVRAYQQTCAEVIQRFDGHVAQLLGDALLVYFGWPRAHEDDAQRAVRAGLGMLEAMGTLNTRLERQKGIRLAIRVGMHTGLVVVGEMGGGGHREQLALGDTPNIASRIQGLAAPDTVLISAETYRLVQGYFTVEELGAQALKGVAAPMGVYRVLAESGAQSRLEVAAATGLTPLVGRDAETALLLERWAQSVDGQGQTVVLSGEAGIGKSRLVEFLRQHVASTGATSLALRCSSYRTHSAFYPLIEHLQRVLQWQGEDPAEAKLGKLEQALGAFAFRLDEVVPLFAALLSVPLSACYHSLSMSPQQQRQQTQDALVAWLLAEAARQPILTVWEDLHWADPSTLETLQLLLEQVATAPILVLLTCRPEFHPTWPSHVPVTQITLNRLGRSQIEAMLSSLTDGMTMPAAVIEQIIAKTDGVPLFVEELVKMLLESGLIQEDAGQYVLRGAVASLAIPATLHDSLMACLDHVGVAKRTAQLGATIGREFTVGLLRAVSPLDAATLEHDLERLQVAELVYRRGMGTQATYMFKHALIQETAYTSLLKSTRQQYHQRIAEVLEAQFPEVAALQPELLAHHYAHSPQPAYAIPHLLKAAAQAQTVSAMEEAIQYLQDANAILDTLDPASAYTQYRIAVLLQQERLYDVLGRREQQHTLIAQLFTLLQSHDDAAHLAEVYVRQGDLYTQLGRFAEAEQALEVALRLRRILADPAGESHVLRSLGFLRWYQGQYAEARVHNEAALALDRQRNDRMSVATDLTNLGAVLRSLGEHERALACLHEALEVYETMQHPTKQAFTLYSMANIQRERAAPEQAMRQYQQAYDLFVTHHDRQIAGRALAGVASILWEQGKTQESLDLYHEVLHIDRNTRHGQMLAQTLRTLGELLSTIGALHQALPYLQESTTIYAALEDRASAAAVWAQIAEIYERDDEKPQEALAAWERVRALRLQEEHPRGALEALRHMVRLTRQRLRDPAQALQYLHDAVRLAEDLEDWALQGEFHNTMGIVAWQQGRYPEALEHYECALQLYRGLEDMAHAGIILNSMGVTLRCMQRYEAALAYLEEAVATNRQAQQRLYEGHGLAAIGDVYRDLGDHAQARDAYQASLHLRQAIGDRRGEAWMLYAVAQTYVAQDMHAQAQRSLDEVTTMATACADDDLQRACARLRDTFSKRPETDT